MNAIKHFITITKHRHAVIKHGYKAGILFQSLFHDLSKYTPSEFISGAKYFKGNRSPNEVEREKFGYSKAWLHHKGRNRHHFEYWLDYNPKTKKNEPVKMPINFVKEMFCDRVAASKIYQGKNYNQNQPIDYFMRGKSNRVIHKETSDLLEYWLNILSEKGENEAFNIIKNTNTY